MRCRVVRGVVRAMVGPMAPPLSRPETRALFANIKSSLPELERLLAAVCQHWTYEDAVYRFYHRNPKVFELQASTVAIVDALQALAPQLELDPLFREVIAEGTCKDSGDIDESRWLSETRSILEAFCHARFFLEMVVKYGHNLEELPDMRPRGWAAVLRLFGLR